MQGSEAVIVNPKRGGVERLRAKVATAHFPPFCAPDCGGDLPFNMQGLEASQRAVVRV